MLARRLAAKGYRGRFFRGDRDEQVPLGNAGKEAGRLGRREVFQGGGQSGREGGQEMRGRLLGSDEAAQFPAQARHTLPHNTAGHDVIEPAHVRAETGNF
jgi:hypothetical protein